MARLLELDADCYWINHLVRYRPDFKEYVITNKDSPRLLKFGFVEYSVWQRIIAMSTSHIRVDASKDIMQVGSGGI